jgi:hypothetical protein
MKKISFYKFVFVAISLMLCNLAFPANEQFRSIVSGNWNANSTWEMSTNNGSTWIPATLSPTDASGTITIRFPNIVTVTASVSADQVNIDSGTVSINTAVVFTLLNGTGNDLTILKGGTVAGDGIFQTQGTVAMNLRNGSNFNAALKINTGTATVNDQSSPFTGKLFGTLTVDAGATLFVGNGGYFLEVYKAIVNNGTISGTGSATLVLKGISLTNNSSVTIRNLRVDSTSSISGAGSFTSNTISVSSAAALTLTSNVTFSPVLSFTVNNGGTLNLNSNTLTFNSGTFEIPGTGIVLNSGLFQTQGTVSLNLDGSSSFNAPLKVNTGTTTANDMTSPYIGRLFGTLTVDNGATLDVGTGTFSLEAYENVTNNGTITGTSNATFGLRGPALVNNGSINCKNLRMDSVSTLSGSGSYTSDAITITAGGNISLLNDLTFTPITSFNINNLGIFNLNTRTFTFNSGTFNLFSGGTVMSSGLVRTQGTVVLNIDGGSNFNAPVKVNTGTTTANDISSPYIGRLYGALTVDNGAVLNVGSGSYQLEVYNNVTNNGTITGTSTAVFALRGASLVNSGSVNCRTLRLDTVSTLSGAGTFTSNTIQITASGNITLLSAVTFSPGLTFTITGGTLNPNTHTFTFTSGELEVNSNGIVSNSGLVHTQGTVALNIDANSSFNAPLLVSSGTTTANDQTSPFVGRLYGAITINSGATLSVGFGGYFLEAFSNVTNNGTITGSSNAAFRFVGTMGPQTLQGTGSFTVSAVLTSGAVVNLTTGHQLYSVLVNTGTTFNIGSNSVKFSAQTPLTVNGTFNNTDSKMEFNGTLLQTLPFNISYYILRVNNPNGAIIFGSISIADTLSIILGDLDLFGNVVTISPTGYLTETPGNTVKGGSTGYIITTRNVGTPTALNVGGMGAVLTATTNLGITTVRRGNAVQTGLNGGTSIRRYFDITPTNNSGLNATLVYKYDDSELNLKPEPSLKLFKSTNSGGTWLYMGGTVNIAASEITLSGLTSFSRWSADSSGVSAAITTLMQGFYDNVTNKLSMSDTVRAYLRNSFAPYAVVDSSIGIIDSLTFKSSYQFPNAADGNYYIQLKHRNSLDTWSKFGVNYQTTVTLNYDFTFTASQSFGNNTILKGVKYCMYSGDVTQDGFIDLADVVGIYNNATAFANGYVVTDVNGDLITDLADVLIGYNNAIAFVSAKTPLNP